MNGSNRQQRRALDANLPEPVPPSRLQHEEEAEEAGRAAGRYRALVRELAETTEDRDTWRRQCLIAEERVAQLELRESELRSQLEQRTVELGRERDTYRVRLVRMVANFETAGGIVLQCMKQAKAEVPEADLKALAAQEASRQHDAPVEASAEQEPETQASKDDAAG
jgi:hypothetical protein